MEHIVYLYWAAILLLTVPSLPFNRVAAAIVAQRIITQLLWQLGSPEPPTQGIVFGLCFVIALYLSSNWKQSISALIFAPMAIAALYQYHEPVYGWWAVFWLACAQAISVPFGNDWAMVKEGLGGLRDISWIDGLFRRTLHDNMAR